MPREDSCGRWPGSATSISSDSGGATGGREVDVYKNPGQITIIMAQRKGTPMTAATTTNSTRLVRELLDAISETATALLALSDEDLAHACSHGCALGGDIRRLIIHNTGHDREHAGNLASARARARRVQESELANLLRDWLHARADLVGELMGADDELIEAKSSDEGWSIREHVEHVIYWERDSIACAIEEART